MTTKFIYDCEWSPKDLVDWLLNSAVHFILTHVHQGVRAFLMWNMCDLQYQLQRLSTHSGFPNGNKLNCPVFLQDKYNYLNKLPFEKVNDTLQVFLTEDIFYYTENNIEFVEYLKMSLLENNDGSGWVIKAPYTTNSHYIRFAKSVEDVVKIINKANIQLYETIPYIMIQPCMNNRKEYKVVCFNEKVQFLAHNPKSVHGISFSSSPHKELFEFAHLSLQDLKSTANVRSIQYTFNKLLSLY